MANRKVGGCRVFVQGCLVAHAAAATWCQDGGDDDDGCGWKKRAKGRNWPLSLSLSAVANINGLQFVSFLLGFKKAFSCWHVGWGGGKGSVGNSPPLSSLLHEIPPLIPLHHGLFPLWYGGGEREKERERERERETRAESTRSHVSETLGKRSMTFENAPLP